MALATFEGLFQFLIRRGVFSGVKAGAWSLQAGSTPVP